MLEKNFSLNISLINTKSNKSFLINQNNDIYYNNISLAIANEIDIIELSSSYFLDLVKLAKVIYILFPLFALSKSQKIGKRINNNIYIINNS